MANRRSLCPERNEDAGAINKSTNDNENNNNDEYNGNDNRRRKLNIGKQSWINKRIPIATDEPTIGLSSGRRQWH